MARMTNESEPPHADSGETLSWDQAFALCETAVRQGELKAAGPEAEARDIVRLAEAWLARGQMLEFRPELLDEAVVSYEKAIAGFEQSKGAEGGIYRLAVGWMNLGNAQQKRGGAAAAGSAAHAYQKAIDLLAPRESVPPQERCTLGAAQMNYALAVQETGAGDSTARAESALDEAIAVFRTLPQEEFHFRRMLAAATLNKARLLVRGSAPNRRLEGVDLAREAITLLESAEQDDPMACEIGLKARCLLCEVYSASLFHEGPPRAASDETVAQATDICEEALTLINTAEQKGATYFRPVAHWLYRLGVSLYGQYQPQFLGEFVQEYYGGAGLDDVRDDVRGLTLEVIERTRATYRERLFSSRQSEHAQRWLQALDDLKEAGDFVARVKAS